MRTGTMSVPDICLDDDHIISPRMMLLNEIRPLPEGLMRELERTRGPDILYGPDPDMDRFLDAAAEARDPIGVRLLGQAALFFGEADNFDGDDKNAILVRAARASEAASRAMVRERETRRDLGGARTVSCIALHQLAESVSGKFDARPLYARAIRAGEEAVQAYSAKRDKEQWISAQHVLARALAAKAEYLGDAEESRPLMERAIDARKAMLQAISKTEDPRRWVQAQYQLAAAYLDAFPFLEGIESFEILKLAAEPLNAGIETIKREPDKALWVNVHELLGLILMKMAKYELVAGPGATTRRLLAEAAKTIERAAKGISRKTEPKRWALNHARLASVLKEQAQLSSKNAQAALYSKAVVSFEAASQEFDRERLPKNWAELNDDYAMTLMQLARLSKGKRVRRMYARAIQALDIAVSGISRESDPVGWGSSQAGLASLHLELAAQSPDSEAENLFRTAMEHGKAAMNVFTRQNAPEEHQRARDLVDLIAKVMDNRGIQI